MQFGPVTLLLLSALTVSAQTLPFTQRLYCNLTVGYTVTPRIGANYPHESKGLATGTCWVAKVHGGTVIVTAGHNLGLGPNFVPAPLARAKPVSVTREPLLGVLAYTVAKVGVPRGDADWVALLAKEPDAVACSQVLQFAEALPKVGEKVIVIGYPDTAHEQRTERTITTINPGSTFIVFNQPLEPGYSGGVVLNAKGEAVGVVITTDKKQSIALLLNAGSFDGLKWESLKEVSPRIPAAPEPPKKLSFELRAGPGCFDLANVASPKMAALFFREGMNGLPRTCGIGPGYEDTEPNSLLQSED
jgi:Trypsin-like peptidase domain